MPGKYVEVPGKYDPKRGSTTSKLKREWKPDSMMAKASEMKLLYDEDKHLASLYVLLRAPLQQRNDWAAIYRTGTVIDRARKDGDHNTQETQMREAKKAQIKTNLPKSILGNDDYEEAQITKAVEIMYINADVSPDWKEHEKNEMSNKDKVVLRKDKVLDEAKRVVSTDSSQGLFHLEMDDELRGFILLDRHSAFVREIENSGCGELAHPPSKEARKVNLVLLDTMLVATAQHDVNFRINQAVNEVADDEAAADNEAAGDQPTIKKKESVPLKVIEASVLMPYDDLEPIAWNNDACKPHVLKITGDRYVSGQRRKRCYYLATYNKDDCDQLVKVLKSIKNNEKLVEDPEVFDESLNITMNPAAEPDPAEGEGQEQL